MTSPSAPLTDPITEISPRRRRRRGLAGAGVLITALLLTGCTLPTFGEYKGSTTQARTEFHLWQGFFIAGIVVGGFVLLLIMTIHNPNFTGRFPGKHLWAEAQAYTTWSIPILFVLAIAATILFSM